MKIKCVPEDFEVTEITSRQPTDGMYSLYRLRKQSHGTLESLRQIQHTWNLAPKQLSHAGLKDRKAITTQFVTIRNGAQADLKTESLSLEYLGGTPQPMSAGDIVGNRFRVVLRSVSKGDLAAIQSRFATTSQYGFPNYFDEQRFGSLGESGEFVAAKWCQKDYERATWLALAERNPHDGQAERVQRRILRDNWNDWIAAKQQLSRSNRRSVVTYLVDHPEKFRKAFALINPDMRGIYLSAFQSAVWNRMLASHLQALTARSKDLEIKIRIGDALLPIVDLTASDPETSLPLPSARCKELDSVSRDICDAALVSYKMNLTEMKLSFPRDRWFSRGQRNTVIIPGKFLMNESNDEMHQGFRKVELSFDLPRGSYATMLVKSLTGQSSENQATDETEVSS